MAGFGGWGRRWRAVALRKTASLPGTDRVTGLPESSWYSVKRRLLGPPLASEQLRVERLSKPLGLGVLSCDGISSANYGSELILHELLPFFGLAAFTLLLPMTGVILAGVALVVLSYREVVTVYTWAGGSYVVARENFGPRVAQVAAVALMVDCVVTVAVQTAVGSAAILSTFPALARPLGDTATLLLIAVTATLVMCYVNLLGGAGERQNVCRPGLPVLRLGGSDDHRRPVPGGVRRWAAARDLARRDGAGRAPPQRAAYLHGDLHPGRAFANGGSSLTGIEAVSNAVSALRPPEGRNARQLLVTQGAIVAFLIAGISWLAHLTHAVPYVNGFPTVLSQEASLIFGQSTAGKVLYFLVQAGAISILFTGGNTSFSGFPFLTGFVAEDSFLPRWLSKRGHRLVFSNGILVLTVLALALLLAVGANTNNLVPFYAIGVFTGFAMAGFGMARYHRRTKEPAWRRRRVINFTAGVYTALVVVIFAIVKFTEGAWLVVAVFPAMVFLLIRLNRQYRREAGVVEALSAGKPPDSPNYQRRTVLVLVDDFDLAAIAALRYARSLRPTALRAVHFVIDQPRADHLLAQWQRTYRGIPLDLVDCPHRRIERPAGELAAKEACLPGSQVTVLLPRRSTRPLLGRLLHDRTADKIAGVVSRIPRSAAMIIPFDVTARTEVLHEPQPRPNGNAKPVPARTANGGHHRAAEPPGVVPISTLASYRRATVAGRVHTLEFRPVDGSAVLACVITDTTGELTALFYGRTHITGLRPGSNVQLRGTVSITSTGVVMANPAYELLD